MSSRSVAVTILAVYLAVLVVTAAARGAGPPAWWLKQAACIRSYEGWWTANTGNGYYGAYQFLLSTWRAVGGKGYPHQASPSEQTYRAWLLWNKNGRRWAGQWGTASRCGLR